MELVSIQLQLVSSASHWQHQKELSDQMASASLLLWRQPLYQLKCSHLSPGPLRGAAADCGAREEPPHEVGTGGWGSSLLAQKTKPDPWLSHDGRWKGDCSISAPWDRLTCRHVSPCSLFNPGCCSFCYRDTDQPQSPAPGLPKALLEGRLLRPTEGFARFARWAWLPKSLHFDCFFSFAKCLLFWGKILHSGHFSQPDVKCIFFIHIIVIYIHIKIHFLCWVDILSPWALPFKWYPSQHLQSEADERRGLSVDKQGGKAGSAVEGLELTGEVDGGNRLDGWLGGETGMPKWCS